jgi:2'-5' RNA ligase
MHRLFVAIRLPSPIQEQVLDMMEGLAGARWQDADQLHLTLRFIGDVDGRTADDIVAALASVRHRPVAIRLEGVGAFGTRGRTNALWSGVSPHDELAHLHRKVDQALVRAGLESERRAYLPHITLARFGRSAGDLAPWIRAHAGLSSPDFTLEHFALYESHLRQAGATYDVIERYPLVAG